MIELAVLGQLKERPMHGYQLNRELSEHLGGLSRVSYGSLYPSLRRLERQGAITSEPGATGARRKTVYAITAEGAAFRHKVHVEVHLRDGTIDMDLRLDGWLWTASSTAQEGAWNRAVAMTEAAGANRFRQLTG